MAKITIEELSENLKMYLDGLGLTETQVQELIDLWVDNKIDKNNNLQTEAKTIVEAINEVKESIDNKDLSAYQTVEDNNLQTEAKTIVDAINEIYNSQDTIKQELIAILLSKGLSVTTDMSFNDLMSNLSNSSLIGINGTAVASNVLSGKTFINSTGNLITGTITNRGTKSITPSSSQQTLPAGYYSNVTISGDSDLIASNIKQGVSIFGVTGNLKSEETKNVTINASGDTDYEEDVYCDYVVSHSLGVTPSSFTVVLTNISGSMYGTSSWHNYPYCKTSTLTITDTSEHEVSLWAYNAEGDPYYESFYIKVSRNASNITITGYFWNCISPTKWSASATITVRR